MRRIKIIYDGTTLANTFSTSNSDRTGVYFVVYNVLVELLKRNDLDITLYCEENKIDDLKKALKALNLSKIRIINDESELNKYLNKKKEESTRRTLRRLVWALIFRIYSSIFKECKNDKHGLEKIKQADVFFSPFQAIPKAIRELPKIKRYTILYDVTPLALPNIEKPNKDWFSELDSSLNENDSYFSISRYTKKDFCRYFPQLNPNKITTTYLAAAKHFYHCKDRNLINITKKKYGIRPDVKYIFSLCTLQPRKNLIFSIKAFVSFIKKHNIDDLYFVLGGGHWDIFIQKLTTEIENLDRYRNKIIRIGYVKDKDLAPLYSGAHWSVYASLYEGFGLPILEAMQCGCPMICSNVTAMPEVIGDAGLTFNPRSQKELVKAYYKMYFNLEFRESCIKKGLQRSSLFSWKKNVDIMSEKIIEDYKNER